MFNPHHAARNYRKYHRYANRRNPDLWALLLGAELVERITRIRNKPQLTLLLMGGMTVIHFRPEVLLPFLPGRGQTPVGDVTHSFSPAVPVVQELCMHPTAMLQGLQWTSWMLGLLRRFFLSALLHGDEWHLYYNMASFFAKGVSLERKMGVKAYGGLLAYSLVTSQALLLLLSWILMACFDIEGPMHTCTVGFSGVLFALKYILNRNGYDEIRVLGFNFRVRYATWVELVVTWLLVPYSSFLGHLSGILAGVLYTEMPVLLPFLRLIPGMIGIQLRPSRTFGHGTVGGRGQAHEGSASGAGASSGTYSFARDARARARASYDEAAAAAEEREIGEALRRSTEDAKAEVRFAPRDEGLREDSGAERQGGVGDDTPPVAPSAPRVEDLVHDDYGSANGLRARRIPSSVEL